MIWNIYVGDVKFSSIFWLKATFSNANILLSLDKIWLPHCYPSQSNQKAHFNVGHPVCRYLGRGKYLQKSCFAKLKLGGTLSIQIIPSFCQFTKWLCSQQFPWNPFIFFDKIKLILYPKTRNSMTQVTLICGYLQPSRVLN